MQGYHSGFARVYNLRWTNFARQAAPRILAFYESTLVGHDNHTLLDLCCGTGNLLLHFLDNGYQGTGLDLSEAMLGYARENAAAYIVTGQARFVQGNAANFSLDEQFGLVVSTYDALNHLPDMPALRGCFQSVFAHLLPGGIFIFDLNTRLGLSRWTGVMVEDTPDLMLISRSIYDEQAGRALVHISGFFPAENGLYERFEETAYNIIFDLSDVEAALREAGFGSVRFAGLQDLNTSIPDPELELRIFIVAEKANTNEPS
jgi:SAM-dependent methyltransferase